MSINEFAFSIKRELHAPLLSSIMQSRAASTAVCAAVVVHCGLASASVNGWRCPFLLATGVPCPGCGLTRACLALLHGRVQSALTLHLFAPAFILAFCFIAVALALPENGRTSFLHGVEAIERRTGLTGFLVVGLVCYWLIRLTLQSGAFIGLLSS